MKINDTLILWRLSYWKKRSNQKNLPSRVSRKMMDLFELIDCGRPTDWKLALFSVKAILTQHVHIQSHSAITMTAFDVTLSLHSLQIHPTWIPEVHGYRWIHVSYQRWTIFGALEKFGISIFQLKIQSAATQWPLDQLSWNLRILQLSTPSIYKECHVCNGAPRQVEFGACWYFWHISFRHSCTRAPTTFHLSDYLMDWAEVCAICPS